MNRLTRAVFFLLLMGGASCINKNKVKVLPQETMQAVLWDIVQADAYTANFIKKDSTKNEWKENAALQKKIFELHKIKREDFIASYDYYSSRPEVMKIILDSISAKAERDRNKVMMERYGGMKTEPQ